MNQLEVQRLAEMNFICGHELRPRRLCLLAPGHEERHSDRFPPGPITEVERLHRRLAKKSALAERRDRHERQLQRRIADLEQRQEWVESFLGFRIEYRLRGGSRRLRRWRRQLGWAFRNRTLSGWRW